MYVHVHVPYTCTCTYMYVYMYMYMCACTWTLYHFQFAIGWWCVIDACAELAEPLYAAYHICGIFSTIALLM